MAMRDAARLEFASEPFDRIAALRVYDPALFRPLLHPWHQLSAGTTLCQYGISKIRPVEATDKTLRVTQLEKTLDIVANALRCRRREREDRNRGMRAL